MAESNSVRIAFVGCGEIAQAHWRGIQSHAPQLQVVAAVDRNSSRAAEIADQTGGRAFASLEDALAWGNFDAVDIMLPHIVHEEAAILAFAAGKHVVLEKPMATTIDACERILAAAREAGTVFMIAEQSQYWPDAVKVQRLIRDGAIGEIITARAASVEPPVSAEGPTRPWRLVKAEAGGGICIDGGLHWIRPLRMWLGDVDEVVAALDYPHEEMEGESLAYAIFRFASGKLAAYEALRAGAAQAPNEDFRVTGTEGILVIENGRTRRTLLYDLHHPEGHDVPLPAGETRSSAYGLELADFARAVLKGTPLTATPEDSLGDLRTVLAMYRSAESRQWEKVQG